MRMDAAITFSRALGSRPSTASACSSIKRTSERSRMMPALTLSMRPARSSRSGRVPSTSISAKTATGMMEAADEVFAFGKIDAGFAADGGIDLGEECGGHLNVVDSAHEDRGEESANVAHDAAAKGDQQRAAIAAGRDHLAQQAVRHCAWFCVFRRGDRKRVTGGSAKDLRKTSPHKRPDFGGGQHKDAARQVFPRYAGCVARAMRAVRCRRLRRILPKEYRLEWFARCFHPNGLKCMSSRLQDRVRLLVNW